MTFSSFRLIQKRYNRARNRAALFPPFLWPDVRPSRLAALPPVARRHPSSRVIEMIRRSIRPEFVYNGSVLGDHRSKTENRLGPWSSTVLPSGESRATRSRCLPFAEQLVRPLTDLITVDYWTCVHPQGITGTVERDPTFVDRLIAVASVADDGGIEMGGSPRRGEWGRSMGKDRRVNKTIYCNLCE